MKVKEPQTIKQYVFTLFESVFSLYDPTFHQAKYWRWWQIVMCGGSILSFYPLNPHGHKRISERRRRFKVGVLTQGRISWSLGTFRLSQKMGNLIQYLTKINFSGRKVRVYKNAFTLKERAVAQARVFLGQGLLTLSNSAIMQ